MPEYRIVRYRGSFAVSYKSGDGRRIRHALGTTDRALAETRARAFWQARSSSVGERIGDLVNAYIDDREQEIKSTDRQRNAWKALKPVFDNLTPATIDRQLCRDYSNRRMAKGLSSATAHYELSLLRQAMNWAENMRFIERAPKIWLPKKPPPREYHITKTQFADFLGFCATPHVRLFAIIGITTAARSGAILDLTWDRVDFERRLVNFNPVTRIRTTKGRGIVPINDRCLAALDKARPMHTCDHVIEWAGRQVKSVKKGIGRAGRRSGIYCTPHVLRHSAAVWMAEAGTPMPEIAQYLGHENDRTTQRVYARYSPEYLKGAAAALDW